MPRHIQIYSIHKDMWVDPGDQLFTVYCALPGTLRGHYDEEIDVVVKGGGQANRAKVIRTAEAEIALNYDKDLKVKKVERRW